MVLTKYLLILLDKPNIKFEVLELYKLTQVQNQIQKDSFDYIVLELYDLIQVQNVEEVIRRYYDDNANVLPAKSYCSLAFSNNTYEEFNSLIEYIGQYVLQ